MQSKQTINESLRCNSGSKNTIHHNDLRLKNVFVYVVFGYILWWRNMMFARVIN